jgi:hypothetical protein
MKTKKAMAGRKSMSGTGSSPVASIRFPQDVMNKMQRIAKAEGKSVPAMIRERMISLMENE